MVLKDLAREYLPKQEKGGLTLRVFRKIRHRLCFIRVFFTIHNDNYLN